MCSSDNELISFKHPHVKPLRLHVQTAYLEHIQGPGWDQMNKDLEHIINIYIYLFNLSRFNPWPIVFDMDTVTSPSVAHICPPNPGPHQLGLWLMNDEVITAANKSQREWRCWTLHSSCTHACINANLISKFQQCATADELVSSCTLLEFEIHRSWVVQVLDPVWIHTSWHQKRILETINMHYYRFPCVNHVGFASPPSFNATVVNSLIVSWVSSETGAPTVEYGHLWAPARYANCHILLMPTGAHVLRGETGEG